MNWLLLVVALILAWRIAEGFHRGMVKEIISFVSLIVLCLSVLLLGTVLSKYFAKDWISMAVAIILLLLLCIVHRLLSLLFFSMKMIAKLPVIKTADKVLGAVIGIAETILIIWTVYSLIITFNLGIIETLIIEYTSDNPILAFLYKYNYLQHFVDVLAQKMHFVQII